MYKRDLITAEIQQLVKAIAQLTGLKVEGKDDEADHLFESVLQEEFGLTTEELIGLEEEEFKNWLKTRNYKADKLDLFSKFLYARLEGFEDHATNKALALKLLSLYRFIETEHHVSSFENLGRQRKVKQFSVGS